MFYNASTVLPQVVEGHLHGETVSFGVLVLLTYDKQFELRDKVAAFYKKCNYPTTLAALDIKADEIDRRRRRRPGPSRMDLRSGSDDQGSFQKSHPRYG